MLTMVPFFAQMIAIVVWASLFFLLINAPLTSGARRGRGMPAWNEKTADPLPLDAGKGRPLVWRKLGTTWVPIEDHCSINSCRSR